MRTICSILRIRWQDRMASLEVLERANSISIETMLLNAQLHWVGHVIRMDSNRIPRHLLYGELNTGKRNQCRPRKRFKDNIKENLQWCNIHSKELKVAASERSQWRTIIRNASVNFENDRHARDSCHRTIHATVTTMEFQCSHCARNCMSRLGLQSHLRVHRRDAC